MKSSKATTVDRFIEEAPAEAQPHLKRFRQIIKTAAPDAEETIGYGKPYYKYHGWMTGVTLYSKHMGIEIWDGLSETDREILEAAGYKTGSMQFQVRYADQEVPTELLAQLVKAQAARNKSKQT